jgi:CheY-like chemotaxis protein
MPDQHEQATRSAYRLLIVDDEAHVRDMVQRALTRLSYHVDVASSGQEALEMIEGHGYDLALLDIDRKSVV